MGPHHLYFGVVDACKPRRELTVTQKLQILHGNKTQRGGVQAITQTGWGGSVVEDVVEMRAESDRLSATRIDHYSAVTHQDSEQLNRFLGMSSKDPCETALSRVDPDWH